MEGWPDIDGLTMRPMRTLIRIEPLRERFVDENDTAGAARIGFSKSSALDDRDAHRVR